MVTTKINIDLAKKTTAPVVYAMQNDSDSRVVEAHLFVNGLPFDIGEASLSVLFQKPDGKGGWYDKLPDESNAITVKDGNVVSAILAPQVLNVDGWVIAAIRVDFADGGILSTFPFKIFVEKDPSFGGVESNDYFNVSNWGEVNEAINSIKENALVLNENGLFDAGGKDLRVGALEIDPGLDTVGIILNAEVPEPVEGEERPTGALSFYDSSYDRAVILRNIADGEGDSDAVTVRQLNEAIAGIPNGVGTAEGAVPYYSTEREEIGVSHENINTAYIWGLYDALMAEYPDNVQKKEYKSTDGAFTNYAYVFSTGDYRDANGVYQVRGGYDDIKKPKYLVMSGVDGHERKTVFSTYRFVRDVLSGHNVPKSFKEGAILNVLPVGCPWGFDNFVNMNENSVYVEDNFDCEWEFGTKSGVSPASEKETQAITKWLTDNVGADLYISYHNSGAANEIVAIMGDSCSKATDTAKKIALKGVGQVIPFWRDVIHYPAVFEGVQYIVHNEDTGELSIQTGDRKTIFSYSAQMRNGGTSVLYAQENLGIPSFDIETPSYYKGTYAEWEANDKNYEPEPIAAGAEAIGNILLEFYAQSLVPIQYVGTPIYNGEALFNTNIKTHAQYTGETE